MDDDKYIRSNKNLNKLNYKEDNILVKKNEHENINKKVRKKDKVLLQFEKEFLSGV